MAQAGYTPISLYYSTTSTQEPTAGNLVSGELAINIADGKLFYKNSAGNVRLLSIGYGSSSVTPTNGGVQYGTGTALALTAAGSSGQILRSNGAAAPTWADLSTLGVNTISFGTTGLTPNSATAGAVTVAGTLVTANGGTGLGGASPFTANGVLYASSASALTSGSALTFDGSILSANQINIKSANNLRLLNSDNTNSAGIWNPAGSGSGIEQIAFSAGGSEQMRLTSTGLGIGTSSPTSKLYVTASVASTAIAAFFNTDTANGNGVYIKAGGANAGKYALVIDNAASSSLLYLDSSGNLGLGVTPSAWSGRALDMLGNAAFAGSGAVGVMSSFNAYHDGTNWRYKATTAARAFVMDSANHIWLTAGSGTAGNAITFTQAMTLDASGNLGIGSTSPSTNLVIGGTASGAGSAGSLGVFLSRGVTTNFYEAYDGTKSMIAGVDSNQSFIKIGAFSNHPLAFVTNNTERARITSGGDLLVGTTSSLGGYKFQIYGDLSSSYGQTVTSTQSSGFFINFSTSSGQCGYITGTGTSSSYVTSSDYRLKENIAPMTGALAKVAALKPCTYTWKADGSAGEGFIAHELQEVAPYAVSGEKDGEQMQGVDYGKITPLLTAALQEAITQIKSLKARVAKLEAR